MRISWIGFVCLVLAQGPAQASPSLDGLSWLAGCWRADGAEPGSVEHWLPAAGGTMFGVGRTVKNGRTVAHEFMQIRATTDGSLEYSAWPSGQKSATFALVRLTDAEVVFENPRHDFPQRVIYARNAPGRLAARIEGATTSGPKVIHFPMTRTACEP
jgi:Domain of unknown function (DUF6265)